MERWFFNVIVVRRLLFLPQQKGIKLPVLSLPYAPAI
jgi:hypothetical protein